MNNAKIYMKEYLLNSDILTQKKAELDEIQRRIKAIEERQFQVAKSIFTELKAEISKEHTDDLLSVLESLKAREASTPTEQAVLDTLRRNKIGVPLYRVKKRSSEIQCAYKNLFERGVIRCESIGKLRYYTIKKGH